MENYFNKSRNSKCSSCYTSHKTLGNSVGHRHSGQTGRKQLLPSNIISGKKNKNNLNHLSIIDTEGICQKEIFQSCDPLLNQYQYQ